MTRLALDRVCRVFPGLFTIVVKPAILDKLVVPLREQLDIRLGGHPHLSRYREKHRDLSGLIDPLLEAGADADAMPSSPTVAEPIRLRFGTDHRARAVRQVG